MFGDALLHLIPEAFADADPTTVSISVLAGIIGFLVLEKILRWKHDHDEEFSAGHAHIHPVGHLVLVSDGVHNFIDGLTIGVAFLVSPEVGYATTVAIILHEIPQEIGDFALLLHAGFSRTKALLLNFASALVAVLGVLAAFFLAARLEAFTPLIAAFAAGNFIYIAGSDLVPELHKTTSPGKNTLQLIALFLGLALMYGILVLEG
jgi:zinc and cadmium transporter